MYRNLFAAGALMGVLAVAIGAFGAHGLENKITDRRIGIFETGVTYHFYHTFAIFLAAFLSLHFKAKIFQRAGWIFFIGILLFSGSLYLLATRALLGIDNWTSILGPITPIGGTLFMIGWGMLLWGIRGVRPLQK
ncbi:MAG: DUF423 domain-containing protein [Bacteroidota bacterium]